VHLLSEFGITQLKTTNINVKANSEEFEYLSKLFEQNDLHTVVHEDKKLMMSRLFLLVKLDSTPVGGLESRYEDNGCLKILNLSIEKKFQKKMIGSYLLKSLEDYISEFHRDINKLSGIAGNDSKAFYEKNGYTFDGMFHSKLIQV
tara:strand:- start:2108 stop:2545 length:438 start_codon:yes stop_codon:yes gene_type:complete